MMTMRGLAMAATAAIVLGSATRAQAVDLTGEWQGYQVCDRYNGEKFQTTYSDDTMLITQDGDTVYVAALFDGSGFALVFQGTVINENKRHTRVGEAALTECHSAPASEYSETARVTKIDTKRGSTDAEFVATSIFAQHFEDATDHGTCTWKYRRVSSSDPGVPACSEVAASSSTGAAAPRRP